MSYYDHDLYSATPTNEDYLAAARAKKKEKRKKATKGVCALLAVAMVGTAGGFGGSALYAGLNPTLITTGETSDNMSVLNTSNIVDTDLDMSVSQIVATTQPSVVEITTEVVAYGQFNQSYVGSGAGSGVIISEDGYIVTNHHVIDGASTITVKMIDGTQYDAELIGSDAATDLAVLKVSANGLHAATIGSSADLAIGDFVLAIGNPLGQLGGTVSDGIVSALSREITIEGETMTLLQTNAAISPGNSGGGLFNENGELIAIVNAKSSSVDVEGIGFAIPMDIAAEVIDDIINVGYVQGRFTLGVSIVEISDEMTAAMYRVDDFGVYIQSITQGGNAHLAGMQVGDRLVEFNGEAITTFEDLEAQLEKSEAGDTVEITVDRGNELIVLRTVLNETDSNSIQAVKG